MSSPAPRRRATAARPSRTGPSVVAGLVLVVLAVLAVALTPAGDPARQPSHQRTGQTVDHTVLACPLASQVRHVDTSVAVGLAPAGVDPALGAGGTVRVGPVGGDTHARQLDRGRARQVPAAGGPVVEASGDAAAGLFGARADVGGDALALSGCPEPRAQWWFTAAGAGLDHASTLDLVNVDPGPAVVDIDVLGPDGPVDTVGTRGITLPPGSDKSVPLTDIAPQTDELAVRVRAERGRVVATVDDRYAARAGAVQGREWLGGTDRASRVVRLSGVPASGDRTLEVANPGELEAVVEVRVAGGDGTFTPTGLKPLTVAPGTVQDVDLSGRLPRREAVAVQVTSSGSPVLATMRTAVRDDHAYAVPVLPLSGPAAAPLPRRVDAEVQVTAGAAGARVRITAYDGRGRRSDGTSLGVAPSATAAWSPSRRAVRTGGYLVVQPAEASGHVHGAVSYKDGRSISVVPLVALPLRLERPSVRPGLD